MIDARRADAPVIDHHDAALPPDACVDSDHDGVCDSIEWPCGPLPPSLPDQITMQLNEIGQTGTYETTFILDNINVDNMNQRVVVAPSTTVAFALHYDITDTACASCRDQIEVGWVPGKRAGCVFDQDVPSSSGAAGDLATTITVPSTTGAYDLRTNIGQNNSCDAGGGEVDGNGWWQTDPGPNYTIAKVCVH